MIDYIRRLLRKSSPALTAGNPSGPAGQSPQVDISDSLEFEEELARELEPLLSLQRMPSPGQDGAARLDLPSGEQAAAVLRYGGLLGQGQSAESFILTSDVEHQPARLLLGITEGNYKAPVTGLAGVIALSTLAQHICGPRRSSDLELDLRRGFAVASQRLREVARMEASPRLSRWKFSSFMGMPPDRFTCPMASVTAFAVCGSTAVLGHIGEGRAYLLRRGQILRLSEDHTLTGQMGISQETIDFHGDVPIRLLGGSISEERFGEVQFEQVGLEPMDTLLLLSANGLEATEARYAAVRHAVESPDTICQRLLDRPESQQRPARSATVVACRRTFS